MANGLVSFVKTNLLNIAIVVGIMMFLIVALGSLGFFKDVNGTGQKVLKQQVTVEGACSSCSGTK